MRRWTLKAKSGLRVAELFAGVGGFRLGLERAGWEVIWSNQWEPGTKTQYASWIYESHFSTGEHLNEDIAVVLDKAEAGELAIPDIDLVCGGFPCQDYSVAKPLPQASGIEGKKGVLWWEIHRLLKMKQPRFVLLENVDRLLKSPASRRGRDFAIILACLADLGYWVEWRIINAADYGFPQRRRRIFVVAHKTEPPEDAVATLYETGVLARAFPVIVPPSETTSLLDDAPSLTLDAEIYELSETFGSPRVSPFENAGVLIKGDVWTRKVLSNFDGDRITLRDVLQSDEDVPSAFFIPSEELAKWRYLKGAKSERRRHANGHEYFYQEGAIAFPDPLEQPSRTILTGEGGRTPSRFKHVVAISRGHRRLTPIELERLNGFPEDWTAMAPEGRRAFLMGNALVVGVAERIGRALSGSH